MPFEAAIERPSSDRTSQRYSSRSANRLATRKGSMAETKAIIENCGNSKKPMLCGASAADEPGIVWVAIDMGRYVTQAQGHVDSGHQLSYLCNAAMPCNER